MGVLLFGSLVEAIWAPYATLLLAGNRPRALTISMAIGVGSGTIAGGLLLSWLGPAGMALGIVLGDLVSSAWLIPLKACRLLVESLRQHMAQTAFMLGLILGGSWLLMSPLSRITERVGTLAHLASLAVGCGMIGAATGFLFLARKRIPAADRGMPAMEGAFQ
jgi:hypothetical protein